MLPRRAGGFAVRPLEQHEAVELALGADPDLLARALVFAGERVHGGLELLVEVGEGARAGLARHHGAERAREEAERGPARRGVAGAFAGRAGVDVAVVPPPDPADLRLGPADGVARRHLPHDDALAAGVDEDGHVPRQALFDVRGEVERQALAAEVPGAGERSLGDQVVRAVVVDAVAAEVDQQRLSGGGLLEEGLDGGVDALPVRLVRLVDDHLVAGRGQRLLQFDEVVPDEREVGDVLVTVLRHADQQCPEGALHRPPVVRAGGSIVTTACFACSNNAFPIPGGCQRDDTS